MLRHAKVSGVGSTIARSARIGAISSLLVISLTRCAYDWDLPSTTSALDGDDGSTTTSEAGSDAAGDANASHDASQGDAGVEVDAKADADAAFDANLPIVDVDASCSPSVRCESGSYCRYADQNCGAGNPTGVCTSNQGCAITSPGATSVCSCSGAVYPSACAARDDGQDISASAMCSAPANNFQCGYAFCPNVDFCIANEPTDGGASNFACNSFNGCLVPTCGCTAPTTVQTACGGSCSDALLDIGQVEVTCQ